MDGKDREVHDGNNISDETGDLLLELLREVDAAHQVAKPRV